jgi:L-aspartate oxidase
MQQQGVDHLWLDLRPVGEERLRRQFPTILGRCLELGLQPTLSPIPVAPAAHYWMGGVRTDLQGATTLPGLYAVGEVACTGVHGANRLASNSLMECLVFARQLASLELAPAASGIFQPVSQDLPRHPRPTRTEDGLQQQLEQLRQLCWSVAGVERSGERIRGALQSVHQQRQGLEQEALWQIVERQSPEVCFAMEPKQVAGFLLLNDLHQRLVLAELLMEASLFREESRGGHFRKDAPARQPFWERHSRQEKGMAIQTDGVDRGQNPLGPL